MFNQGSFDYAPTKSQIALDKQQKYLKHNSVRQKKQKLRRGDFFQPKALQRNLFSQIPSNNWIFQSDTKINRHKEQLSLPSKKNKMLQYNAQTTQTIQDELSPKSQIQPKKQIIRGRRYNQRPNVTQRKAKKQHTQGSQHLQQIYGDNKITHSVIFDNNDNDQSGMEQEIYKQKIDDVKFIVSDDALLEDESEHHQNIFSKYTTQGQQIKVLEQSNHSKLLLRPRHRRQKTSLLKNTLQQSNKIQKSLDSKPTRLFSKSRNKQFKKCDQSQKKRIQQQNESVMGEQSYTKQLIIEKQSINLDGIKKIGYNSNCFTRMILFRKKQWRGDVFSLFYETNRQFVLSAQRTSRGDCYIYNRRGDYNSGQLYLAKLESNFVGSHINIYSPEKQIKAINKRKEQKLKQLIGTIETQTQSFLDQMKPRQFSVYLFRQQSYLNNLPNKLKEVPLSKLYHQSDHFKKYIHKLQNKKPKWAKKEKVHVIDMHGRAKQASIKNFIMCDQKLNECLLFGKVQTDVFNVDFTAPLNPFLAMAISLSSFIYKPM